jgi:uncharacterized protein (TIRG00374 family)
MKTKTIIGMVLTVVIVGGLFIVVPPSQVIPHLRSTNPIYLVLACLVNFATIALRAKRWHILIGRIREIRFIEVFKLLVIGITVNSVIPLRAGEAMRAYSLASRWSIGKAKAISTVLADKSFDAMSFGVLVLVATRIFELPPIVSSKTYGLAFSSLALMLSFPIVAHFGKTIRHKPKNEFASALQRKIALKVEPLMRGYSSLSPRVSLASAVLSVAAWIVQIVVAILVARAVGITLPLGAVVMAVFAVNIAAALPLTPAGVGVFQIAFLVTLSAYGFDKMASFAVAALFQAVLVIPVTVLGLALLNHRRKAQTSSIL